MNARFIFVMSILCCVCMNITGWGQTHHCRPRSTRAQPKTVAKRQENMLLRRQSQKMANHHNATLRTMSGTSSAERLIAVSGYNYTDTLYAYSYVGMVDSAHYYYSGNRGSNFDYNSLIFDEYYLGYSYAGYYSQAYYTGYAGYYGGYGAYTSYTNYFGDPNILADTALYWISGLYYPSPDSLNLWETSYSFYDTNNNVVLFEDMIDPDSAFYDSAAFLYFNTYNDSNEIATSWLLGPYMGTNDTFGYIGFQYDGYGNLLSDTVYGYGYTPGAPSVEDVTLEYYDASGNLTEQDNYESDSLGGMYGFNTTLKFYYNSDNLLLLDSMWIPTGYTPSALALVDSFGYTTGIDYNTFEREYDYGTDSDTVIAYTDYIKHVSPAGLADTLFIDYNYPYYSSQAVSKTVFLYDSLGKPTTSILYFGGMSGGASSTYVYDSMPDYVNYFYYQLYDPHYVPRARGEGERMFTLFPNPGSGTVYINRENYTIGEHTALTLTDSKGRTVRSTMLEWLFPTQTIDMQGLLPGLYWLTLRDNTGHAIWQHQVEIAP